MHIVVKIHSCSTVKIAYFLLTQHAYEHINSFLFIYAEWFFIKNSF